MATRNRISGEGDTVAVTGAFSYTGKYIARRLLASGKSVLTLTRSPTTPQEFAGRVRVMPFYFDQPERLVAGLEGCSTLYNTYWIRFKHGDRTFDQAIRNTQTLLEAARQSGVHRIVHVSVTNPSMESELPYFRGKAVLEKTVQDSGLSYAVIRPTLIFGLEDILLNNIAFLLRRFPIFAIPGNGAYQLQPISAEETAEICVAAGEASADFIQDAAGPEVMTFHEMVELIRRRLDSHAVLIHTPPSFALGLSRLIGRLVGDVILTRDEMSGLMAELLVSDAPPVGKIRLGDWIENHSGELGLKYVSELKRNFA